MHTLCTCYYVAFVIIWIRYRHIKAYYADSPAKVQLLNIVSFIFGFLSMIGLIVVGSFQVRIVMLLYLFWCITYLVVCICEGAWEKGLIGSHNQIWDFSLSWIGTLRYDKCTGGWLLYRTQEYIINICETIGRIFLKTILGCYIGPVSHAS